MEGLALEKSDRESFSVRTLKWVNEGGFLGENSVLYSVCLLLCSHLCFFPLCLQLPHLPHISECLMKRSLKPTDLRDMTIGQLQVIVNDLHSQIESKCETLWQMGYYC